MNPATMIRCSYDYGLVVLSVVLAIFASYTALDITGRVSSSQGKMRGLWLLASATTMGLGIWAMHYVGMLALHMPVPVYYHVPTVLVSLLAAVAASGAALYVVGRPRMNAGQEIAAACSWGAESR